MQTTPEIRELTARYSFRIVRKIADGGMGSVYEAIQDGANGFQKRVAVKTLLPRLSRNLRFVEMFIAEAKLVADLVHENIVQILQLGRSLDGYYIVMEYVNGLSVADFIRAHIAADRQIPEPLAVFITSRVARGLAYSHSRVDSEGQAISIVHRDVCPNNVMITTEGLPKVTDFGIAKARHNVLTSDDQALMGKITYMSPEQAGRKTVDFRTDQFALGALLFELLSLRKIREAGSQEGLFKHAVAGYVDWSLLEKRGVQPEVEGLMRRCLALAPADRYASTNQLAHDLEYCIYRNGYGPTIRSLEAYLRQLCPHLYGHSRGDVSPPAALSPPTTVSEVSALELPATEPLHGSGASLVE